MATPLRRCRRLGTRLLVKTTMWDMRTPEVALSYNLRSTVFSTLPSTALMAIAMPVLKGIKGCMAHVLRREAASCPVVVQEATQAGWVLNGAGAHELSTPTRRRLPTSSSLLALARSPTTALPAIMRRNWCRGTRSRPLLTLRLMGLSCNAKHHC